MLILPTWGVLTGGSPHPHPIFDPCFSNTTLPNLSATLWKALSLLARKFAWPGAPSLGLFGPIIVWVPCCHTLPRHLRFDFIVPASLSDCVKVSEWRNPAERDHPAVCVRS